MKGFGSDNHAPVHPSLLQSLIDCNLEHQPSYGTDEYSEKAINEFKNLFGQKTEVFFVFNGTACNVLALRFLCSRHEAIICSDISHLHQDECGAPEFFAGKLLTLPTKNGKLQIEDLKSSLVRKGDQHYSQPKVVSITQPTEVGTCYSLEEIKEISLWAKENNMYLHVDGARLPNALIHLNCTFKEMTTDLGVDVVSFGGTKNGLMMGEAILVLNSDLALKSKTDLKYIRKQSAQLPSKTRYIANQFYTYLNNNLYLEIAAHSCKMATKLDEKIKSTLDVTQAVQSNAVFAKIPKDWVKSLKKKHFFYVWNEQNYECRLMCSWDTKLDEIESFVSELNQLAQKN